MLSEKKCDKSSVKLCGMLLLMAALLPCLASATAIAEEDNSVTADLQAAPCKGLKPFNNLDELLYQFYINLDSGCLFEMPVDELEKIWGIKILDEERFKPKNLQPVSETEFYYKPYKTENDAFYVQLSRHRADSFLITGDREAIRFSLKITKEYFEKQGALFSDGSLPKLLPKPNTTFYVGQNPPCVYPRFSEFGEREIQCGPPYAPEWLNYYGGAKQHELCTAPDEESYSVVERYETCYFPGWKSSMADSDISLSPQGQIDITRYFRSANKDGSNHNDIPDNSRREALPPVAAITPCKSLKPFNNLDELLYQFYINLDSDCLFTMPVAELEKAWDIKILSDEHRGADGLDNNDFYYKPYKSEKDSFYVETLGEGADKARVFNVAITKEYYERHATLFPDSAPPKLIPEPLHMPVNTIAWSCFPSLSHVPKNRGGINDGIGATHSYWLNSQKSKIIVLTGTPGKTGVHISTYVPSLFEQAF